MNPHAQNLTPSNVQVLTRDFAYEPFSGSHIFHRSESPSPPATPSTLHDAPSDTPRVGKRIVLGEVSTNTAHPHPATHPQRRGKENTSPRHMKIKENTPTLRRSPRLYALIMRRARENHYPETVKRYLGLPTMEVTARQKAITPKKRLGSPFKTPPKCAKKDVKDVAEKASVKRPAAKRPAAKRAETRRTVAKTPALAPTTGNIVRGTKRKRVAKDDEISERAPRRRVSVDEPVPRSP